MKFRLEQCFARPLGEIEDAFVDPDLFVHLCGIDDIGRPTLLKRVDEGGTVRMQVRYTFTGELSPTLTAIVEPHHLTWVEVSTLDRDTHRTAFNIIADHYPDRMRCAGTVELIDDGQGGTRRVALGSLDARIPLIRDYVEGAIVKGLLKYAATEANIVGDWLVSRRQAET